jgi:outer membrane biosynthesis protein TonB
VTCCVVTTKCVEVVKPVVVEKKVVVEKPVIVEKKVVVEKKVAEKPVAPKKEPEKQVTVVENKVKQSNTATQKGNAVSVGLIATKAVNTQGQQQSNAVSTATKMPAASTKITNDVTQSNTATQDGDAVAVGVLLTTAQNTQVQVQSNSVTNT